MTDRSPGLLAGRRVLIAEDETLVMMTLEDMLEELEAEIVGPVASVGEIVPAADDERPDAVTLDVNLKGEPSYAAAAALRERGIPFVFVSGYDALPGCPADLQATPHVKKPFRLVELAAALEAALRAAG